MHPDIVYQATLEELQKATIKQLREYPKRDKNILKLFIKSIIRRRNLFIKDNYFWPNGLLVTSLEWSHRKNGDKETLRNMKKYYNKWIKKGIPLKNIDYTINGYSLIYLYLETNDKRYLKAIDFLINYLKSAKTTEVGSIPYRVTNGNQVLVDTLGMICPFLCRYGYNFDDEASLELAVNQLNNFLKFGIDSETNLPYHGYNVQSKTKLGIIGWGRAIGWLLIGLVDSLEYIPKSNKCYDYLCNKLNVIISAVVKHQLKDGNFAWQITAVEGHVDSSSTSMICYAIKRAVDLGIISAHYRVYVDNGIEALHKNTVEGLVQNCSAECRGVSMYPQEYRNYPWAQGPATALFAISID